MSDYRYMADSLDREDRLRRERDRSGGQVSKSRPLAQSLCETLNRNRYRIPPDVMAELAIDIGALSVALDMDRLSLVIAGAAQTEKQIEEGKLDRGFRGAEIGMGRR